MARVSIFIDGANFLYGIKSINNRYTDFKFDFEKYVKEISKGSKLIDVYYYNAALKQARNPELYKQQQRLFARLRKASFKIKIAKRQPRISKEGTAYFEIKGDDISLAIDMLKDAYENKYDNAILISGDGDFAPLVKYVRKLGKKVENLHFEGQISLNLIKECNSNSQITKRIVNKFFYCFYP